MIKRDLGFGWRAATAALVLAAGVAVPTGAAASTPSPPAGAPAVEFAPASLTGLSPQLPAEVLAASAARGSRWSPEKAVYGTASRNDIAIAGAGGTTIRVNEIYPTTASGQPAPGRFPVLLTMTPYGKGQGGSSAPGSAAAPSTGSATGGADNYLVQRGYIEVVEDVRGTGDSGGSWGLFDPVQQQDAIHVLQWAAHLPQSDGRVGTYGPSYLGIDQLLLAGAVGPHSPLKAIFPMVPANDIYRDTSFMGGLIDFEFDETYLGLTGGLNIANPLGDTASDSSMLSALAGVEADHAGGLASYHAASTANILTGGDEAYDGAYWHARNPQNVLARIVANHIPAYIVGGEFDIFQHGEPLDYAALQNAWAGRSVTAPMAPDQRTTGRYQLIDGPWEHINGSSVQVDPLELEWFDTWLKHERTGMASTPTPLHYYDLGTGRFAETTTFPFTGAAPVRLYLGAGNTLSATPPGGGGSGSTSGPLPGLPPLPAPPLPPLPTLPGLPIHLAPLARSSRHRRPRHARVEPGRQSVRAPGRPVGDGRNLDPHEHGRDPGAVRERRPSEPARSLGAQLHDGTVLAPGHGRRSAHGDDLRRRDAAADGARGRARGGHPRRHLVPAHRGRAARLAARARRAPVVDREGRDDPALPPLHGGLGAGGDPRRGDALRRRAVPDARHDRQGRPAAADALEHRHATPDAAPDRAAPAGRRHLHDRALGVGPVVAHGRAGPLRLASGAGARE